MFRKKLRIAIHVLVFAQIYIVSCDGQKTEFILDKKQGIQNPTSVHVDKEGKRLLVINRDGDEIRHYKILEVTKPT